MDCFVVPQPGTPPDRSPGACATPVGSLGFAGPLRSTVSQPPVMTTPLRFCIAISSALALASAAFAQRTFTSQYSFGDSLSDDGNLYALTSHLQPLSPPYFNGRFSNGPTFVELLGNSIVPAATVSAKRGNLDFAFGGATAGPGSPVPNLTQQIGMYQLQGLAATPTDLFTVLAGANDLIAALSAPTTPVNPSALDAAGITAAQAVATNVQSLIGLGARNIVVAGLPNLGATPRSLASGGPGGAGATFGLRASTAYNAELLSRLRTIAASAPTANLVYVDLQGILDRVVQDYRALGYANATSYYLAPTTAGGGVGDPNSYVFFDDIHPTARTHAILAAIVTEELNPEPVLGFGGAVGTAALALQAQARDAIETRTRQIVGSQRPMGRADAYVAFNYTDGDRHSEGLRPAFDYQGQMVTAGVDVHLRDGIFLGGAVDVGRLNSDVKSGRGNFTTEDTSGSVYAVWHGGPVVLSLDGDYGVVNVKGIHRATAFSGFQTNGKTAGTHWGAGMTLAWLFRPGTRSAGSVFLGVRTERVKLDAYTEKDVPSLGMDFAEQSARSSAWTVGYDLSRAFKLGTRDGGFDLHAAYRGEISRDDRNVSGRLANNVTPLTGVAIRDGNGNGIEFGAGLTLMFAKNWSASLAYTGAGGNGTVHRGTLSLQTGF
jgi:outer membrane lipase/esterase